LASIWPNGRLAVLLQSGIMRQAGLKISYTLALYMQKVAHDPSKQDCALSIRVGPDGCQSLTNSPHSQLHSIFVSGCTGHQDLYNHLMRGLAFTFGLFCSRSFNHVLELQGETSVRCQSCGRPHYLSYADSP